MAFKPEERFASAEAFADALEAFAPELPGGAAGAPALGTFLRNHFGEERVVGKTRIPTLATLTAARPTDPEFAAVMPPATGANSGTYAPHGSRPSATGIKALTVQGRAAVAVPQPAPVPEPVPAPRAPEPRPASRRWLFGLVGGLGLVAAGAAVVVARPGTPQTVPPPVQVAPPPVAVGTPPPAATGTQAPATGNTVAGGPEQGTEPEDIDDTPGGTTVATSVTDPGHVDAPETPSGRRPKGAPKALVTLGIEDIQRVVSNGRSKITGCFERYKADLPAANGSVQVQLTIVSSGKVRAGTRGPLASTDVGRCLESHAQSLRFPAHRDQEVTVLMPFSWTVTQ
jgi:hypothetical protein